MTQANLPPDPASDPNNTPITPAGEKSAKPAPPKPRKKRWLRRIVYLIVCLIVLVVALVLLAPTILSTAAARNFVVGKVNDNLNGKLAIGNWSIGWGSGISVDDIKIFDADQRQILQIPKLRSQISLAGLVHGQVHLGDTSIEGLDFFLENYTDGTTSFSRLAKPAEKSGKTEKSESSGKKSEPGKLPSVDGNLQIVGGRGTVQDDKSKKTILFTKIEGGAKIPSINSPIENKLNIAASVDNQELLTLAVDGKLQIAANDLMLPPNKIVGTETITTNAHDLKLVQSMIDAFTPSTATPVKVQTAGTPAAPEPPTKLAGGNIGGTIQIIGDGSTLSIVPNLSGANVILDKGGVPDNVGNLFIGGKIMVVPNSSASSISDIVFTDFKMMGVGSGVAINGRLDDIAESHNFQNLTADLTYNLDMLLNFARPMLSKDQQAQLKDIKIDGNFTKRFTLNGSYPANKPMNEAISSLQSDGEFTINMFDSSGATIKNFTMPYVLSGGKLRIAHAGKPAGQDLPVPADLNNGKVNLGGATIDLTPVHAILTIPDGTKLLDAVQINPLFAQTYLSGWLHNPLFAGADKANAQIFVTMKHCDRLPADTLVQEKTPENAGVADIELKLTGLELGSKFVDQLNSAMALINRGKVASNGVQLSIPQWTVNIAHGVVTQDLKLMIGRNPPMDLAGTVDMKTHAMAMTLTIPISNDQGIKIPVTGTADDPKLDTRGLLEQNLKNIPGIPKDLKGILGGDNKSSSATQPANSGEGVGNLLNDVFNKKDKKSNDNGK